MAEKLTIQVALEPNISKKSQKDIEKQSGKTGEKSGKKFEKEFKDETKNLGSGLKLSFGKLALAGVAAGAALAKGLSAAIDAAKVQEDAVNSLNVALRVTGKFTRQASQDFQDYASSIQAATRFGDEAILNSAALIQQLGNTSQSDLKRATQAAVDLASALRIDLNTAALLVGKAAAGEVGSFSRYGLVIKKGADNAETFARALDAINKKFGGTAAQQVNTFSGATEQLSNTFGDVLEQFGFFITDSDLIGTVVKSTTGFLQDFGAGLQYIREELLGIRSIDAETGVGKLQQELKDLDNEIASLIDREQDLRDGVFGITLQRDIDQADGLASKIEILLKKRKNLAQTVVDAEKAEQDAQSDGAKKSDESTQKRLTNQQLIAQAGVKTDKIILESFKQREEALNELFVRGLIARGEAEAAQKQLGIEQDLQLQALRDEIANREIENQGNISGAVIAAAKNQQVSYVQLGKQLKDLSIRGFGQAFQNIGRALASGQNANQAFVDSVKNTFGEIASAIGDFYIKKGIAISLDPTGAGAADGLKLIAAGAGLKLLSGALSGGGGGGGGASAGGAAPSGSISDPVNTQPAIQQEPLERAEAQGNVTINIDRFVGEEEEAQRVAELLSDAGAKDGVLLTNVRGFA
jgi:hypothetical protein